VRAVAGAAAAILLLAAPPRLLAQDASAGSPLEELDRAARAVVARSAPAVVRIDAERSLRLRVVAGSAEERRAIERSLRDFGPRESVTAAGFLVDDEGLVLTTAAVASGATTIRVSFPRGPVREGSLVGEDPLAGVALLRVGRVEGVRALRISGGAAEVGALALFLAPAGEEVPLHLGFVSSLRRAFGAYDGYLVAGVPVSPGHAGAPLLDARGEVAGMAVAPRAETPLRRWFPPGAAPGADRTEPASTLRGLLDRADGADRAPPPGTFVPAEELRRIAADLREHGFVRRGLLGVRLVRGDTLVTEVPEGLPAAAAGVRVGDRILAVDGVPVGNSAEVTGFVQRRAPGTEVRVRLRDPDGEEREVAAALAELPPTPATRGLFNGFSVKAVDSVDLSAAKFQVANVPGGSFVVVAEVSEDSAAGRAGLLPGDWIVEIDGRPVLSVDGFAALATGEASRADSVALLVHRAGEEQRRTIVLK
jgi:serine protease Do